MSTPVLQEKGHYDQDTAALQAWEAFAAEGNNAWFEWLYRHFVHTLLDYGYKMCAEKTLVEDAVQNLFTYLLIHHRQLPRPRSVKYYLLRCVRNEILKLLRRHNRELPAQPLFDTALQLVPIAVPAQEAYLQKERLALLQQYINRLPARQKEVIYLRFYHGLTYAEVAAVMGIDQKSAYKVIYKAIENLRSLLPESALYSLYLLLQQMVLVEQLLR